MLEEPSNLTTQKQDQRHLAQQMEQPSKQLNRFELLAAGRATQ